MDFAIKFAKGTNTKREKKFITFINKELSKHRKKKYIMFFDSEKELQNFKDLYRLEHSNLDLVYNDRLGRKTLLQPENNTFSNYSSAFFIHKEKMNDYSSYIKPYTIQYYLYD